MKNKSATTHLPLSGPTKVMLAPLAPNHSESEKDNNKAVVVKKEVGGKRKVKKTGTRWGIKKKPKYVQLLKKIKKEPAVAQEEEDEVFDVQEIVDKRRLNGEVQYFVKWLHWPDYSNTWESEDSLKDCKDLINKYEKSFGNMELEDIGFENGLKPKRVRGVKQLWSHDEGPIPGQDILYLVECEGDPRVEEVTSEEAQRKIPDLVIAYWESLIKWTHTDGQSLFDGKSEDLNKFDSQEDVLRRTWSTYERSFNEAREKSSPRNK